MISVVGFAEEPAELRDSMRAAFDRVMDSHHYILGPEVAAFEDEFAAASDVAHAIGVANGLDAIEISLRALGIGPGDEVVTTAMTAFASVLGIVRAGATPVLADIDPDTALLDPESVARCLSPRTRAVLPVHLYGQMRNLDQWRAFADEHGVALIEDCAQAHLARESGGAAGSFSPIAAFSFYPTKNLGAIGDAGAVVTSDPELAGTAKQLRNYGQAGQYEHVSLGLNSRLDELQAALLRARLAWLPEFTARRQAIADRYRAEISNAAIRLLAAPTEASAHVYHQFVVLSDDRYALANHLRDNGIGSLVHYPIPLHQQPACLDIARDPAGLTRAERHAVTCLSLPCHPGLSDADVTAVIEATASFRP